MIMSAIPRAPIRDFGECLFSPSAKRRAAVKKPVWAIMRCCGRTLMPLMCQNRISVSIVSIQAKTFVGAQGINQALYLDHRGQIA